jgi:hypothetical protein
MKIIKYLKTEISYGYDDISTKILKVSSHFISSPSNHISNKLLSLGIFPISQIDITK